MTNQQTTAVLMVVPDVDPPANIMPTPTILVNQDGDAVSPIVKGEAQADSTASTVADLKTDFNALLAKLRTAGVIAEDD